ncbi:hypothetical protein ER13_00930 [Brevundimonas sp. EAKA]|nr:hypothetical protein ER13_00930 [Brevundimonas sp. EAKA]
MKASLIVLGLSRFALLEGSLGGYRALRYLSPSLHGRRRVVTGVGGVDAEQGGQGLGAGQQAHGLQKGLFLGRFERQGHRQAVDQGLHRRALGRIPVDVQQPVGHVGAQGVKEGVAVEVRLFRRGRQIVLIGVEGRADLAIGRLGRQFGGDAEPRHPGQGDQIPTVRGFRKTGDPPGAADRRQAGQGRSPALGLDQADDPVPGHGVVHHVEIARLEDVQRQLAARQQYGPLQREHRDHLRQIEGSNIALRHHVSLAYRPAGCLRPVLLGLSPFGLF